MTTVPAISTPLLRFFRRIVRGYFRRHFHAVRVANSERFSGIEGPLLVYANHTSWWDPMVSILLAAELMPKRRHYAPMDAAALEKYGLLKRLGIFPVEMKTSRGAAQFLRTGEAILQQGGVLWVTPQGRFSDARERPLVFKPGLAALAERVAEANGSCTLLPLAIEYPFWDERLPETLLYFAEPVRVYGGESRDSIQHRAVEALEAALEANSLRAIAREPAAYDLLSRGTVGSGGFYAFGKRMKSILTRQPYIPEHTPASLSGDASQMTPMLFYAVSVASMLCALTPCVLFVVNLRAYRPPELPTPGSSGAVLLNEAMDPDTARPIQTARTSSPKDAAINPAPLPSLSVLIPARDEAHGIEAAVNSVLGSTGVAIEVVVMDDHSTDGTGALVAAMAARDARVRLELAPPLPRGWNGKQHACYALAHAARYNTFCFVDADVRLEPEALARMVAFMELSRSSLVSGFPRQVTGTWLEWLLLPLIHFVLLGYLPVNAMRRGTDPAFAAGCGQFLMVERAAYFGTGGHAEIKATMHDGLLLPRLFRQHGLRTDLADLTRFAQCRMYRNAQQVWSGLAKNATEGIASPVRILPISLLLALGQIVPFFLLAALLAGLRPKPEVTVFILTAVISAWLPRVLAAMRFRQDWRGAFLHPLGIAVLLVLQWYAFTRKLFGGAVSWKSRAYAE